MKLEEIIKKHLNKVVKENESTENYMFFSNIQQIHRQCEMLMKMNPQELDQIIKDGHDWADDHVSEAKNNMDQVFDFFMNETKRNDKENVTADMDQFSMNEEKQLDEKCWDGYKRIGGKKKNGKMVPNCVPTNEASSPAQQAAIAINMKKEGKKPKNESEREMYEAMEIDESKNCPTDPAKWAASKAKAKAKFDVYPSAYANGFAAKDYKSKGGGWRKCK
jgi:dsDNA-specific endonuclease/ATPase MutS2